VPIDDSTGQVSALGESHPAVPQLTGGRLIVPIENAGLGPAVNIRGTLTTNSGVGGASSTQRSAFSPQGGAVRSSSALTNRSQTSSCNSRTTIRWHVHTA
jgi:hypothetical protein